MNRSQAFTPGHHRRRVAAAQLGAGEGVQLQAGGLVGGGGVDRPQR